jgi:hypothetical protein
MRDATKRKKSPEVQVQVVAVSLGKLLSMFFCRIENIGSCLSVLSTAKLYSTM